MAQLLNKIQQKLKPKSKDVKTVDQVLSKDEKKPNRRYCNKFKDDSYQNSEKGSGDYEYIDHKPKVKATNKYSRKPTLEKESVYEPVSMSKETEYENLDQLQFIIDKDKVKHEREAISSDYEEMGAVIRPPPSPMRAEIQRQPVKKPVPQPRHKERSLYKMDSDEDVEYFNTKPLIARLTPIVKQTHSAPLKPLRKTRNSKDEISQYKQESLKSEIKTISSHEFKKPDEDETYQNLPKTKPTPTTRQSSTEERFLDDQSQGYVPGRLTTRVATQPPAAVNSTLVFVIGRDGGRLSNIPVDIYFPENFRGENDTYLEITIADVDDSPTLWNGCSIASKLVTILPHGLPFHKPVTLSFKLQNPIHDGQIALLYSQKGLGDQTHWELLLANDTPTDPKRPCIISSTSRSVTLFMPTFCVICAYEAGREFVNTICKPVKEYKLYVVLTVELEMHGDVGLIHVTVHVNKEDTILEHGSNNGIFLMVPELEKVRIDVSSINKELNGSGQLWKDVPTIQLINGSFSQTKFCYTCTALDEKSVFNVRARLHQEYARMDCETILEENCLVGNIPRRHSQTYTVHHVRQDSITRPKTINQNKIKPTVPVKPQAKPKKLTAEPDLLQTEIISESLDLNCNIREHEENKSEYENLPDTKSYKESSVVQLAKLHDQNANSVGDQFNDNQTDQVVDNTNKFKLWTNSSRTRHTVHHSDYQNALGVDKTNSSPSSTSKSTPHGRYSIQSDLGLAPSQCTGQSTQRTINPQYSTSDAVSFIPPVDNASRVFGHPITDRTITLISDELDVFHPTGHDWRLLCDYLGYGHKVDLFRSRAELFKTSPTEMVLHAWIADTGGDKHVLVSVLTQMDREHVARHIPR